MTPVIFATNNHDYSRFVKRKSVGWKRNDLDSEKTKRRKDGVMRRFKIGAKRTVSYEVISGTPVEVLRQLDDDLSRETFSATYLDLHGQMTKTFYCSSFEASLAEVSDGVEQWEGGSFNVIEV